jgi:putative ABC transport system permease protein
MNASLVYVLRNLGRRRTRTVIGALGIFLTLALLTAIQIGLDSVSISYLDLVALQAGKADLVISKKGGDWANPTPFDPKEVQRALEGKDLRGLSPRFLGVAQVSMRGQEHYAVMIGVDPRREKELDIWGIVPEPALQGQTCALSKSLAEKLKAKAGNEISIRGGNGFTEIYLKTEQVLDRQLVVPQQIRDFVVVNLASARELAGETERVHMLAGAFREPHAYYDARNLHGSVMKLKAAGSDLSAHLGMEYEVRLPKAAAITGFQQFSSPLRAVFGVFALLTLTITGLLIYSLISVSVEERIREYAILRTLGARRWNIFSLVLSESFLLCFLGVIPGVFAGTVAAKILVKLVALAMGVKGGGVGLEVSPATLWLTLGGGALLSIGSALVPALHATRWRIVDALDPMRRGQLEPEPREEGHANTALVFTGLALSTISVVVFFVLPTAFLSGNPSLIGSVILCLIISILLGFTLIMVGALPWAQQGLMKVIGGCFGPVAELAGRNLQRHRRRHTTTALLFTLSVAMVMFLASLVALFSRTALGLVEQTHGADVRVYNPRTGEEPLKAELARLQGARSISEVRFLHNRSEQGIAYDAVLSDLVGMKHVWMVPFGVDTNLAQTLYTNQIQWRPGNPSMLAELGSRLVPEDETASQSNQVPSMLISAAIADFLDVNAGDFVQLSFRLGSQRRDARFKVAGICGSMPGFENFRAHVARATGAGALISLENFRILTRTAPPEAFQGLYFVRTSGEPETQKALAKRVREEFDVRYRFGVQCAAEQKEQAQVLYWVTQVLFGLLLAVAVVIAVFALIASMATTVLERRREIGVIKALGLRRKELFRLFAGESVVLTLSAGMAGGAIGFGLAWLFVLQATVLMEIPISFTLPYLTFAATLGISVVAGLIAAYLPTRNLLRKTAAEILRI